MSVASEPNTAQRLIAFGRHSSELLAKIANETNGLLSMAGEARRMGSGRHEDIARVCAVALNEYFQSLRPAMIELCEAISQRLEHSELDLEEKLELTLRFKDILGRLKQSDSMIQLLLDLVH